jgi:hypothetical protein
MASTRRSVQQFLQPHKCSPPRALGPLPSLKAGPHTRYFQKIIWISYLRLVITVPIINLSKELLNLLAGSQTFLFPCLFRERFVSAHISQTKSGAIVYYICTNFSLRHGWVVIASSFLISLFPEQNTLTRTPGRVRKREPLTAARVCTTCVKSKLDDIKRTLHYVYNCIHSDRINKKRWLMYSSPTVLILITSSAIDLLDQQHTNARQHKHNNAPVHRERRVDHEQGPSHDRCDHPTSVS